jgi:hypothetical protein
MQSTNATYSALSSLAQPVCGAMHFNGKSWDNGIFAAIEYPKGKIT